MKHSAVQLIRVGFDLDGVISRTELPVLAALKAARLVPPDTQPEQITAFDYSVSFPSVPRKFVKDLFTEGNVFRVAPYDAGGLHCLNLLSHAGIETHIVTHRPWERSRRDTSEWLSKVGADYSHLHFVSDPMHKAAYCTATGLDVFIEDKLETAEMLTQFVRMSMLYDRTYNRREIKQPDRTPWGPSRDLQRFYRFAEVLRFFGLEEHAND